MQVQKHLFRIAQKSNKTESAVACWRTIFYISIVFGTIFVIIFASGQLMLKKNLHQLQSCLTQTKFTLKQDQIGLIYQNNAITEQIKGNTTPISSPSCQIYKNLNTTESQKYRQLQITSMLALYKMQQKDRAVLQFDNYTFVFNKRNVLQEFVYGADILFANQIINLINRNQIATITQAKQIFFKANGLRFSYQQSESVISLPTRIFYLVQIFYTYAIASIITSLYIYVTIIASPALILIFLQLTPYGRTQAFFSAFQAFPWIGMHSLIFRSSTNVEVRSSFTAVCFSLITYFIFMYLGYYKVVLEISNQFFDQPIDAGVGEILFGYFAIVQFAALIYMRTRPFIKYFPIINMLFIFFFMLYCKFIPLGFKFPAALSLMFYGISLFSYMVLKLQIEAQQTWPADSGYTPNIKQPRAGLLSTFNLNWINALPEQWTILMPLVSRQNFTNKELSFVQQSYENLGQYLNQR